MVPSGGLVFNVPSSTSAVAGGVGGGGGGGKGGEGGGGDEEIDTSSKIPHMYTQACEGSGSDSNLGCGPRLWLPCIDSPSSYNTWYERMKKHIHSLF